MWFYLKQVPWSIIIIIQEYPLIATIWSVFMISYTDHDAFTSQNIVNNPPS
jgi:hypothetical protein